MRSRYGSAVAIVVAVLIVLVWRQGTLIWTSRDSSGFPKVFAPSSSEQTPPGMGKFVLFTREQLKKDWDFMAGAWECIPSRPDVPVTKRVEFGHSSWSAVPFIHLCADQRRARHLNFVSLNVDKAPSDCDVNLYDIDYRTWNVRCIWRGHRLRAFGVLGESVFCQTDVDWLVLDIPSSTISKDIPFTPLEVDGDYWLVRKLGELNGCWSYSTKKSDYCGHFETVDQSKNIILESRLSPDGKTRALLVADLRPSSQDGLTKGRLIIQQHGRKEDHSVPVEFQYDANFGHPIGTGIHFPSSDQLEFYAWRKGEKPATQVWLVDMETKRIITGGAPSIEKEKVNQTDESAVPVPEYLRKEVERFSGFGTSCLAPAFLMHLKILSERPQYSDCTCGVSPDGRHVLFSAKKGPLSGFLIYGDLVTKKTVRWTLPKEITPHDLHQLIWVETPE